MSTEVAVNGNLFVVLVFCAISAHIILNSAVVVEWQKGKNARDLARVQNAGASMTCPCGRDCACFAPGTSTTTEGTEGQETKIKLA